MDVNLQESLALRRRLHAKETIDILHEFLNVELSHHYGKGAVIRQVI